MVSFRVTGSMAATKCLLVLHVLLFFFLRARRRRRKENVSNGSVFFSFSSSFFFIILMAMVAITIRVSFFLSHQKECGEGKEKEDERTGDILNRTQTKQKL